jgi:hypothetical protein
LSNDLCISFWKNMVLHEIYWEKSEVTNIHTHMHIIVRPLYRLWIESSRARTAQTYDLQHSNQAG